jgi:hypothetical protein
MVQTRGDRVTIREFTLTVSAPSAGYDWTPPAVGEVKTVNASASHTLDSVGGSLTFTINGGTAAGINYRGIYRDSGIAYSPTLGAQGAVLVSAGGHNDSANNGTYRFDCKTGTWSVWKSPSNVFRNASNYDVETVTGSLLSSAAGLQTDENAGSANPGATHNWSHSLILPSGLIPGTTGQVMWRAQVGCGWTTSSMAVEPFWYTDLSDSANPWVHLDVAHGIATSAPYLNGSAYYGGKVYFFPNGSVSTGTAVTVDLATGARGTFTFQAFRNGSGWVTQITDNGVPYFLFVGGTSSADRTDQGGNGRPRVRLINALTGVLSVPAINNHTVLPFSSRASSSLGDFYYSSCWSEDKRAIYLTRWISDPTATFPDGAIGTDAGVTATSHTTTKVYKLAAGASLTDPWTVSEQTVASYYTPDTGSQMRPRSFYINGCVVNFASTGAPVQAIGVS